ncbi:unnamed protein product, partial [Gongylonema pulchrum]|uniref:DNA_pol_B_exo1 domain-containing protein n=1 Tax=Gongylonema pulchrum TaxID=637853 RepID=A0A183E135_9BILA
MAGLSMRNITCDYYMERPNGFNRPKLHATAGARVPIIRQKCCVNVHGVFPYIIVRTGTHFTPEFARTLRARFVRIVMENNRRHRFNPDFAIYEIRPLLAKSLYGYHKNNENFVQILFYNPFYLKIAADCLQMEVRKNAIFQVYESHVPYILQFFIDHSIFGMDLVHFDTVKFRVHPQRNFNAISLVFCSMELLSPLLPSSTVAVECDVWATDISNALLHSVAEISPNPGLNYIWKDEQRRCQKKGEELVYESSQEERPATVNEKEYDYLRRLRTFARSIDPTLCSATLDSSPAPDDSSSVVRDDASDHRLFETADANIFDRQLFLDDIIDEDFLDDIDDENEQECPE